MVKLASRLFAVVFVVGFFASNAAQAMSVKDFDQLSPEQQGGFVTRFVQKMTSDIAPQNPTVAQEIRDWFSHDAPGKRVSEGAWNLYVELGAIDHRAEQGKSDPSKIEIESVIVWVIEQKFTPPGA